MVSDHFNTDNTRGSGMETSNRNKQEIMKHYFQNWETHLFNAPIEILASIQKETQARIKVAITALIKNTELT